MTIIKIDIDKAGRYTFPDGQLCYGDSDGETLYNPETDVVTVCLCPNCQEIVKPDDKNCSKCGLVWKK